MAVRGPRQQVGLVEPAGAGRDDVGHRDLAGVPVGAPDGRGAADAGVAQQRLLDDPGVDVVAAADDQVLGPPGEGDEAAGVDAAEVAGVQPAVTDDAVPADPGAAQSRVGDVPGEHGGAADHQLAGLAGGAVGPRPVLADPDGFDLLPGQDLADRSGAFLAGPGPGAGAGGLGEAVAFQQVPPGVSGEVLAYRGRQRGRAHDRQPQRADVGVDRDLRQGAVDGGHGGHRRDLVVLDDLPEPGVQGLVAVARRAWPHHPGAAEHRGDAGDDQGVDVEQRQPAQHPLPGRQPAALRDALGAGELVGVGVRGDLRGAGGPPGVHERGEIACLRQVRAGQVAGRLPGDHLVQIRHDQGTAVWINGLAEGWRVASCAVRPKREDGGHARLPGHLEQPLPQLRVQLGPGRDQDPGSGPADQLGDPLAGQRGVGRRGDPDGLRGQGGGVQHRGVDAAERDRVLAAHSQGGQRVGDPRHHAGQLGVGPGQAASVIARVRDPLRGDAVRPGGGGVQQQLVGRFRPRQYFSCGHGVFPIMVLCWVPRSSCPSGEAIVAMMTSPSCR